MIKKGKKVKSRSGKIRPIEDVKPKRGIRKKTKSKFKPKKAPKALLTPNNKLKSNRDHDNQSDIPNTFLLAAKTLKIMSERKGSAGSIVVKQFKSYNKKHIYAIVVKTLENIKIIKKAIYDIQLMKKVPMIDNSFLLEILVGDLLFGKGLSTIKQNDAITSLLKHKPALEAQVQLLKKDATINTVEQAKFLRVNHLRSNMKEALSKLKAVGLEQLEYSKSQIKYKKFVNKFHNMSDNEFMIDFHFEDDLIALKSGGAEKLKKTDLIKTGKAILQDKASFMAVAALDPQPNQKIIDACCAPGGKTSAIATKMNNKGKIIGFDVNKDRLLKAKHLMGILGAKCVQMEVQDFSKVKLTRLLKTLGITNFDSILIDPSCSGSGIQNRLDYSSTDTEIGRLKKLQAFQVSMLKHALKSGVSDHIVYCTCSISEEENEMAIEMALNESGVKDQWSVVEVLPYWQQRGLDKFEFGSKCIRSEPSKLTNGFFIAKLSKNPKSD